MTLREPRRARRGASLVAVALLVAPIALAAEGPAPEPVGTPRPDPEPANYPDPAPTEAPASQGGAGGADPVPAATFMPAAEPAPDAPHPEGPPSHERSCGDHRDEDGDGLVDCADADCAGAASCRPTGASEASDALCSDWIDNDRDGHTDCDDLDCEAPHVSVCRGSLPAAVVATAPPAPRDTRPAAGLDGAGDADGERADETCTNGIDDDRDGRTDCADPGCRLDPEVHVCTGNPRLRFSVYASFGHTERLQDSRRDAAVARSDTNLRVLQLRALGPVRGIEGSFFVVTLRAEQTPRLTYAMVRLPVGRGGHYLGLDSGGAGLTVAQSLSASKLLLLDAPSHVHAPFEQGNGAAAELGGPLDPTRRLLFRAFAAGGAGRYSTGAPGRSLAGGAHEHTWAVGAQLSLRVVGFPTPYDTQLLYSPSPPALGLQAGLRYDQRTQERFPAGHLGLVFRAGHLLVVGEALGKRELAFGSTQVAFDALAGWLLVPRRLLVGAEYGAYLAGELEAPPPRPLEDLGVEIARQHDEAQARAVAHVFVHRGVGVLSLRYVRREVRVSRVAESGFVTTELLAAASCRF